MHKRLRLPLRWPLVALLALSLLAVSRHQAIHDWISLHGYNPPASVVQLADETAMTGLARRVFYINHPAVEDRQSFNKSCNNRGEHTIVLGCYHPTDRGIFIFHVSDGRLDGVDQVTAAHEMLHAAYDRLGSKERARTDEMLREFYAHGLYDERVKATIAAYQKSEPNEVVNEMHSIFGTEVSVLPSNLESYYKRYFDSRQKVVSYAEAYQQEFTSRQAKVSDFDRQLSVIKQQIDANSAELKSQESQISALRARLEANRSAGNVDAYNAGVPVYNARIDSYNTLIDQTRSLISSYNQIVARRNELALQVAELAHSIDSSFQPINQ